MTTFLSSCPHCNGTNRIPERRLKESPKCGKCKLPLLDGAPIAGTVDNFDFLISSAIPVVVDFWASWCNPCVGFAPVFAQSAQERSGSVRFVKIDTEAQPVLASRFGIRSIPTLMVFYQGRQLDSLSGALPKSQFDAWLNQALQAVN